MTSYTKQYQFPGMMVVEYILGDAGFVSSTIVLMTMIQTLHHLIYHSIVYTRRCRIFYHQQCESNWEAPGS